MRRSLFQQSQAPVVGMSVAALAPLVDLFTILVVSVLRASSPEPPMQFSEEAFHLPSSVMEDAPGQGIVVELGKEGLYVNGWRAGSAAYWARSEEILIRDVYEALQGLGGTQLQIRAHADAPWTLVDKTLFTSQQAGYSDIELVALSRSSL